MISNTNLETGIRYGIIAANSLHSDVLDNIQSGRDVRYEEALAELKAGILRVCEDFIGTNALGDVIDLAIEKMTEAWEDDEPVYEFQIDGVRGQTTWLGGALLVWVFESPHIVRHSLCSPCVPNCGDLDSPEDAEGYICYDVPPAWRRGENE